MIGQPKKYILTISQVGEEQAALVGERALILNGIYNEKIPIPQSFVITSEAFDDFLLANDLIEFIGTRINEVDYGNPKEVQKNSFEIQEAIINSQVPDLIADPLKKAYTGFGGIFDAFVEFKTSPLAPELNDLNYSTGYSLPNVKGIDNIVEHLKQFWGLLFSPEALLFRATINFEGALSQAVIVQKLVQAEVSGKVYSVNPTDNNTEVAEIQAILGLPSPEDEELVPDSYFYNKTTEEIEEKKVVSQETMLVRKGRSNDTEPNVKVNISPVWKKKQKLEDKSIIQIGKIAQELEAIYKTPLEIDFAFEAGRIFVLQANELDQGLRKSKLKIVNPEKELSVQEQYSGSTGIQPKLGTPNLAIVEDEPLNQEINTGPNLAPIVEEEEKSTIPNLMAVAEEEQEQRKAELVSVAEAEQEIKKPELVTVESKDEPVAKAQLATMDDLVKEVQKSTENKQQLEQQKNKQDTKFEEKQVVVNILPISKLDKVITAIGFGKKSNFGLAHFILKDSDWLGLTGDEIIVLEEFSKDLADKINQTRGLIIKKPLKEEDIQYIKVPVIHSAARAMEVMRENEVVTIHPKDGGVYVGAGKEIEEKPKVEQSVKQPQGQFESAEQFDKPEEKRIELTSSVYQLYNPEEAKLDLINQEGTYIDMSKFYLLANIAPEYLIHEPDAKKQFIKDVAEALIPTIKLLEEKQVILQASSIEFETLSKLKGSEKINFNHKHLAGSGKYVEEPDLLNIELEILSILRNREALRNVWLALPKIHNGNELAEVKKIVSNFGFRRSSTFKILAEISSPLGAISLNQIIDNDADGFIFNFDKIVAGLHLPLGKELDESVIKFLSWMIETTTERKYHPFVLNEKVMFDKETLQNFISHGLSSYIIPRQDLYPFRILLAGLEVERIQKKKKRGRKKKEIDYGF